MSRMTEDVSILAKLHRRAKRWQPSVRFRLLTIALLPTVIVLPTLLAFAMIWWMNKFDNLLISKVNGDLTIARQYLHRLLEQSEEKIRSLGESLSFSEVVQENGGMGINAYLDYRRVKLALDFLYLVDAQGNILSSSPIQGVRTEALRWPVVAGALEGKAGAVIDIFNAGDLRQIAPYLEKRARLELVQTQAAVPTDRTIEDRGMVVHTAAPVRLAGEERGILVGGILLNQNLVFIDTINDLVYREASLPQGSQGTATLFLDDVRISTNVRLFEGKRALGTRVSRSVREAVLGQGKIWLDRAFVVNDWYISGYDPILDSFGKRVGMLYVGFLEKPFQTAKMMTLVVFVVAFCLVTAIMVPVLLRWAGSIFKPLENMNKTISLVEDGDLSARTSEVRSKDEIGRVAQHLDALLDQVQERDRQLREWASELNNRVEERTKELQDANKKLEATTQQLVMSEKLAAIGEITAGVAHEINNPIAVIQGNFDVVREALGEHSSHVATELNLIDDQIHRIYLIVTKLLQFANPEEFAGYLERQSPSEILTDCLLLVKHLLKNTHIEVVRHENTSRCALINRTELQQVIINLLVNAIHAMPEGGTLTLRTMDRNIDGIAGLAIEVADTGTGMSPETLKKVFDPFFTTKRREGTGLGLSISRTLIARYGGSTDVESQLGCGTKFTIWLPEAREDSQEALYSAHGGCP